MIQTILSPEEIEKIKAEEILRNQIRNEFFPKEREKSRILSFFNSSLGIWLLSSVTVGLVTWAYTQWSDSQKAEKANAATIAEMDVEMANRIVDFENNLKNADNYMIYQSAVYGFLRSAEQPTQNPTQKILNDFENLSTRALLIQLSQLENREERRLIKKAIDGLNRISGLIRPREMTRGEAYSNPLNNEMLTEEKEIEKVLENEVKQERWKFE